MKKIVFQTILLALSLGASAQEGIDHDNPGKLNLSEGLTYRVETQASASDGKTPLWLNANKHGLSSLKEWNGYMRSAVMRPVSQDSARRWGVGYGIDVAVPTGYTSHVVVQQAFAEVRWLRGMLSVGAKEYPMELKNNRLSSGSQTLGINARPVPQVRLALPEYWTLPFGGGWLHMKAHVAYGMMTDESWQHEFTDRRSKYADGVLYHSKAGYLKIGKDGSKPLSLELGLEMAAQFGGTPHYFQDGTFVSVKGEGLLKGMWHAFFPGGSDVGETTYQNAAGNQLGSWVARVNYDAARWRASFYVDRFFEDHSAMLFVDYDGYGQGENWQKKEKSRYFFYDLCDWMLGAELNLKNGTWLRDVVVEFIHTKYQSGPIYHDHTPLISDHLGGQDQYYNHYAYTGWQHWGQVIGNPLYRSPIYNDDGLIEVENNRFMAFHLGFDGQPTKRLGYRALASWQDGLGSYTMPFLKKRHNVSFMVEAQYDFPHDWSVRGAYGMDFGSILGHNYGAQLTIAKSGLLHLKTKKK